MFAIFIVATSSPLYAICDPANERVARITVITCDDPSEAMMERIQEFHAASPEFFERWLKDRELESPRGYVEWLLERHPGVILGVKVTKSRELDYTRQQQDPTAPLAREWDDVPQPRMFFWRNGSCERLRLEGAPSFLYLPSFCCDVLPPSDSECLLKMSPVLELPEWIIEAGYHE